MSGPSMVIRFSTGRITLALDDDSESGLPSVSHRDSALPDRPTPAELSALLTEVLQKTVPRRLAIIDPIGWDDGHRTALTRAAAAAGVGAPVHLIGPVAVAHAVATGLRRRRAAAVVTLSGPAAEIAVLTRTRGGFRLLGEPTAVRVSDGAPGPRAVVAELTALLARLGLSAEQLTGVFVVGDTEPGAPLAAEVQRTLGTATSARRDLDTAAVHGALSAYPVRKRSIRPAAAAVLALTMLAGLAGAQLRGSGPDPAGARFMTAPTTPAAPSAPPAPPPVHLLDGDTGRLSTLDLATGRSTPAGRIPAHSAAWFRLTPDGRTTVARRDDDLLLIDPATGRVRDRVRVPGMTEMVIGPDSRTAYVLQRDRSRIVPVDVATGERGTALTAGKRAGQMLISPDGRTLYVLETAQMLTDAGGTETVRTPARLHVVDTVTGRHRRVGMHHTVGAIALTPDGRTLFVAAGRRLGPLDTATLTRRAAVAMPGTITAVTVTPDGRSVYALCEKATAGGRAVVAGVAEVAAGRFRAEIALPAPVAPWKLSAAPGGRRVFAYGGDAPAAVWIDTATDAAGPLLRFGSPVSGVVHRPDGAAAYLVTSDELVEVAEPAGVAGRSLPLPEGADTVAQPG